MMKSLVKICLVFLLIITTGAMMVPALTDSARAQTCSINVIKQAEDSGQLTFGFFFIQGLTLLNVVGLGSGDSYSQSFSAITLGDLTFPLSILEGLPVNWQLSDVECDGLDGVSVTEVENGIEVICDTEGGEGTCTFFNSRLVRAIPTLSEWGMFAAAVGLGLIGILNAVRRKRAAA